VKWVNTWMGQPIEAKDFVYVEPNVLQKQYFPTDMNDIEITKHYDWLKQFFHHPNYIKVDGKPLFMLYQRKPGAMVVLRRLRELAIEDGFPGLYLTVGLTKAHGHLLEVDDDLRKKFEGTTQRTFDFKLYDKVVSYPNPNEWAENRSLEVPDWCAANKQQQQQHERLRDIPGIISSFDNTPRRNFEEANLFASSGNPKDIVERFRKSLYASLYYESCCFGDVQNRLEKSRQEDDRFILINAMNEWAEGMALEPSDVYGTSFLETIRDTKAVIRENRCEMKT